MIVPSVSIVIMRDETGQFFFESYDINLDKKSLVTPGYFGDGVGTVEFFRTKMTIHPPNTESFSLGVEQVAKAVITGGNNG